MGEDATGKAGLVVYATYAPPLDESEMAEDPFSMVGLAGAIFPDGAGDSYRALCLQFLPEQAGRIEELFATKQTPEFSLINSLRSGASDSAILQELLNAEGPKEMLANFLCADAALTKKLKNSVHWIKDFKDLSLRILGLKLEGQKSEVEDLQATLWRYLLVSEFAAVELCALPRVFVLAFARNQIASALLVAECRYELSSVEFSVLPYAKVYELSSVEYPIVPDCRVF